MKILMVCLGNICRSPLAEGILKKKVRENHFDWEVDSAGTESYHTGETPHPLSQKTALQHGIDISLHRARRFTKSDLEKFDKIYAMAKDVYKEMESIAGKNTYMKKVDLLMNEVLPGRDLSVPDPWYGGQEEFQQAYKLIDTACDQIITRYGKQKNFLT